MGSDARKTAARGDTLMAAASNDRPTGDALKDGSFSASEGGLPEARQWLCRRSDTTAVIRVERPLADP